MRTPSFRSPSSRAFRLAAFGLLLIACPGPDTPEGDARPRNLILISLDTLRADHLGVYGYERPTSPAIDSIGRRGTVFLDASATSPWTKPSHASLFTGLYPSRHGVTSMLRALAREVPTLAEWLERKGFHTTAVVNNDWLKVHGLERGFRDFVAIRYEQGKPAPSPVTPAAIAALDEWDGTSPLFAFFHYIDVHADYRSLPRYHERFAVPRRGQALGTTLEFQEYERGRFEISHADVPYLEAVYDAGVRQLDDELKALFAVLEERGLLETSLLVITSDHGEEFLEHGGVHHGHTQYQEVIRVPLILHGPGVPAGAEVADPVSLVDVMPTALSLLELPVPVGLDGADLRGTWDPAREAPGPRPLFLEADVVLPDDGPSEYLAPGSQRAVRSGRFKYHLDLETGEARLFDLSRDPGEATDVKAEHPEVARALAAQMQRFLAYRIDAPAAELSAEDRESLRAMGYLQDE